MRSFDAKGARMVLKGLFARAALFVVPVLLLWIALEYWMIHVPTSYSSKREKFEALSGSVDTLILGQSAVFWGVSPTNMSGVAFNLAQVLQTPYYDDRLVSRLLPELPKLKRVVVAINYTTLFAGMYGNEESLPFYYQQAWGIPPDDWSDRHDLRMFSRVALRSPEFAVESLRASLQVQWLGKPGDTRDLSMPRRTGHFMIKKKAGRLFPELSDPDVDEFGWWQIEIDHPDSGLDAAAAEKTISWHEELMKLSNEGKYVAHYDHLFEELRAKHIEIDIIVLPVWKTYADGTVNTVYWNHTESDISRWRDRYGAKYFSFLQTPEIPPDEFFDVVHLNPRGAVHFTHLLNAALTPSPTEVASGR